MKHRRLLNIRRQVKYRIFPVCVHQHNEKWEVYTRFHPLLLLTSSCAKDGFWHRVYVFCCHGFNLPKIIAEVANHIGALEVRRQPHKRMRPLAARTAAVSNHPIFSKHSKFLFCCRHALPCFTSLVSVASWYPPLAFRLFRIHTDAPRKFVCP